MASARALINAPARCCGGAAPAFFGPPPNPVRRTRAGSTVWMSLRNHQLRRLSLAYALHEPKNRELDERQPPIIFLHGLFGSKQNNRSISKRLAQDLRTRIYALDLRNHGDSPHDPRHDYESMTDDVEEFMQTHNLPKATLIGHSMGAKVCMTLALRAPTRAAALIPVDNAPVDAALTSAFPAYVRGMRDVERAAAAGRVARQSDADALLAPYEPEAAVRFFLLTNLVRDKDGGGGYRWRVPLGTLGDALGGMGDFPFRDPRAARYVGPTLVVRGSESKYVADDVLPAIGEFFPKFELVTVEGAGHWVISEKPEEFRKAVVDFLQIKD